MTENYEAHVWTAKLLADIQRLVSKALKDKPTEMPESISTVIDGAIPVELIINFGSPQQPSFGDQYTVQAIDNEDGTFTLE